MVALTIIQVSAFSNHIHLAHRHENSRACRRVAISDRLESSAGDADDFQFEDEDDFINKKSRRMTKEAIENRKAAAERKDRRLSEKIKKRRLFIDLNQEMLVEKRQNEKTRLRGNSHIERFEKDPSKRLDKLRQNEWVPGQVMRIVAYGVWVDVAAQMDGFLHVRDMANEFTHHPADIVSPGEQLSVRVKFVDPEDKSLGLSLLPDVKPLTEFRAGKSLMVGDMEEHQEVWGIIRKTTFFGAFIDVGAEVDGFLHVTDDPRREFGENAKEVFKVGDRMRLYVKEIDREYNRLKLTAVRPKTLPRLPW